MRKRLFVVLIVAFFLVGCAQMFGAQKPEGISNGEWNLMQMRSAYTIQFNDAMSMAKNPAITPMQVEIVKKKVAILDQIKPLINAYALVLDAGMNPDPKAEQQIYDLFTQIGASVERKVTK